jgi:hypothetical protein
VYDLTASTRQKGKQNMRTETITRTIYTIDEHPSQESCFDWIRNNWHDLGDHYVDDMVQSLKALAAAVGGKLNYSVSIVPDRGEFVTLDDYDAEKLADLFKSKDECPLTGMCYDIDVIEGLYAGELDSAVLKTLHAGGEYIYSDEGLYELCQANDYEFTENGAIV